MRLHFGTSSPTSLVERRLARGLAILLPVAVLTVLPVAPVVHPAVAGAASASDEAMLPGLEGVDVVDEPLPESELIAPTVDELTTATSTTVLLGDGTYETTSSLVPINYQDEDGQWQEIDNTLVESEDSAYAVENAANSYTASIPADGSEAPIRFETAEGWVTMQLDGVDAAPTVQGTKATFSDVDDAAKLVLETTAVGLKENIVLNAAPQSGAGALTYRYELGASEGLTPELNAVGSVEFLDGAGEAVVTIPVGNMVDSSGTEAGYSNDVIYDLQPLGAGGWELTVAPDMDWLTDPARVYPVTIDPSMVEDYKEDRACWIASGSPTANNCAYDRLRVGRTASGGHYRTLLHFNLKAIPDDAIIAGGDNSRISLYNHAGESTSNLYANYEFRRINANWNNNVTWNHTGFAAWSTPGGAISASEVSGLKNMGGNGPAGWETWWGLGATVAAWHQNPSGSTNFGVMLVQTGNVNNTMYFNSGKTETARAPYITVGWDYAPSNVNDATNRNEAGDRPFWTYEERQLTDKMTAKVNIGNGNLLITAEDAKLAGIAGWDMALTRYYNSSARNDAKSNMGLGWSNAFGGSIRLQGDLGFPLSFLPQDVTFVGPSGYLAKFNRSGDTFSRTEPGINADLSLNKKGTSAQADDEYELKWFDESKYIFDISGKLLRTKDRNGNALEFTYEGSLLKEVADTRNRKAVPIYSAHTSANNNSSQLMTGVKFLNAAGGEMLRWKYGYAWAGKTDLNATDVGGWVMVSSELESVNATNIGAGTAVSSDPNIGKKTTYGYDAQSTRLIGIRDARDVDSQTVENGAVIEYHGGNDQSTGRVKSLIRTTDDPNDDNPKVGFTYYPGAAASSGGVCDSDKGDVTRKAEARTAVDGERIDVTDVTRYCLDNHRRVLRTTDATGTQRSKTWTSNSNVDEADMLGLGDGSDQYDTTWTNDNATESKSPTGATSTADYGTSGSSGPGSNAGEHQVNATRGEDSAGQEISWTYDYDEDHNLIKVRSGGDNEDVKVRYNYCWTEQGQIARIDPVDAAGNLNNNEGMSTTPPTGTNQSPDGCNDGEGGQGNDTKFTYTQVEKELSKVDRPAGGDLEYTYDKLSRVATVKDARNVQTKYTYDALDRVVKITHTKAGETTQEVTRTYDLAGNMTEMDDLNDPANPNTFTFDELNRRTQETGQGPSPVTNYTYDTAGNVTQIEIPVQSAAGLEPTKYEYNKLNLVTSIDDQRPGTAKIVIEYDRKRDKPKKTTFPMAGGNDLVQRIRYDDDGKPGCIYSYRNPEGPQNDYDANNYEKNDARDCPSASLPSLITYFGYDYNTKPDNHADGHPTGSVYRLTEKGGRVTDYTYGLHLKRLETATTKSAPNANTNLRRFEYSYDRHSNLTKTVVSAPTPDSTPNLDRGTRWSAFNDGDQLCRTITQTADPNLSCTTNTPGETVWNADPDGNLITATGGPMGGLSMNYNLPGQTTSVDPPGTAGPQAMAYDGVLQDRRTQVGDTTMSYGYSGLTAQATIGSTPHGELFVRDPGGQLYAMIDVTTLQTRYYLTEKQGSSVGTVSQSDGQVLRYHYEPYGQQIRSWIDPEAGTCARSSVDPDCVDDGAQDAASPIPSSDRNPWGYNSGYQDAATGFTKFGTRYYVPKLGTWTQFDLSPGKLSNPLTLNSLSYAASDPINNSDRNGRWLEEAWGLYSDIEDGKMLGSVLSDAFDANTDVSSETWAMLGGEAIGQLTAGACMVGVVYFTGGLGTPGVVGCEIGGGWVGDRAEDAFN